MENLKPKLKQALSQRAVQRVTRLDLSRSAVLIPLTYHDNEHYIYFTKRTQSVRYHKGQMSFPGGLYEEQDGTLVNTALRESFEEIGLAPADVEVLGELDDIVTRTSNFIVTPFVAFIPYPYQFKLNPREAESLVELPVSALMEKECIFQETEIAGEGKPSPDYVYKYKGTVITGATARILRQLLGIFAQIIEKHI